MTTHFDFVQRALDARGNTVYGPVGSGILFIDCTERRHILPSEFFATPQDFHRILTILFKHGAGGRYVARGNYNLSSPAWAGGQLRKLSDWSPFIGAASGMQLEMSVLIQRLFMPDDNIRKCPACKNVDSGAVPSQGRIRCSNCYVSYQVTEAFIEELSDEEVTTKSGNVKATGVSSWGNIAKFTNGRDYSDSSIDTLHDGRDEQAEEDEIRLLRRIDLALEKMPSGVLLHE
ncbi:hypothetical protein BD410DRAFT_810783, partial [Rickenella mellea]